MQFVDGNGEQGYRRHNHISQGFHGDYLEHCDTCTYGEQIISRISYHAQRNLS